MASSCSRNSSSCWVCRQEWSPTSEILVFCSAFRHSCQTPSQPFLQPWVTPKQYEHTSPGTVAVRVSRPYQQLSPGQKGSDSFLPRHAFVVPKEHASFCSLWEESSSQDSRWTWVIPALMTRVCTCRHRELCFILLFPS